MVVHVLMNWSKTATVATVATTPEPKEETSSDRFYDVPFGNGIAKQICAVSWLW
jgi:hypothetical protein